MNIEWTHKDIKITDIRKVKKFYVISIDDAEVTSPLFVDHDIFERRVNSYYLRGYSSGGSEKYYDLTRFEVINVDWNMVITKGYFMKLNERGEPEKIEKNSNKYYISFLEIAGPLGAHVSS
jgi:hypothetical protein